MGLKYEYRLSTVMLEEYHITDKFSNVQDIIFMLVNGALSLQRRNLPRLIKS
jgi:hypothetical protein